MCPFYLGALQKGRVLKIDLPLDFDLGFSPTFTTLVRHAKDRQNSLAMFLIFLWKYKLLI
jgi:hypothetical protein